MRRVTMTIDLDTEAQYVHEVWAEDITQISTQLNNENFVEITTTDGAIVFLRACDIVQVVFR